MTSILMLTKLAAGIWSSFLFYFCIPFFLCVRARLPSALINLLGCSRYYFDFKLSWLLLLCQCQCVITIFLAIEFQFCILCYAQEHTHTNKHKGNDFYVVWQSNTQMAADSSIGKNLQYFCLPEPKARKSTQIPLPHIFMLHLATIRVYSVHICTGG